MSFTLDLDQLLEAKFPYYRKLLPYQQSAFRSRLIEFMRNKDFSTRKDLELTYEMKVLISAAAVQVTFGLDKYMLDTFNKIIIYPGEYYSRVTGSYHKGDVNLAGIIALSWKDFLEGYDDPSDNRNLGLHEMGHAIRFDAFTGEHDEFFSAYFIKWTRIARDEYEKVRDEKHPVFRKYAGSNMNEFLSVCIEHFFETPKEFQKDLPELYNATCILLNQDPTRAGMGIGIRHDLLTVKQSPEQQKPKWSANSGNTGCIFSFHLALPLTLVTYFLNMEWDEMHLSHILFLVPFLLWMGALSYMNTTLRIYDNLCIISHWPGISVFPKVKLPFEHILSIEVHKDDNMFTLHYLLNGVVHEQDFSPLNESDINSIKEFMDERKVRIREYKAKRPASRAFRK